MLSGLQKYFLSWYNVEGDVCQQNFDWQWHLRVVRKHRQNDNQWWGSYRLNKQSNIFFLSFLARIFLCDFGDYFWGCKRNIACGVYGTLWGLTKNRADIQNKFQGLSWCCVIAWQCLPLVNSRSVVSVQMGCFCPSPV